MKLNVNKTKRPCCAAFSLIEVIMSVVVLAVMLISLFGGFSAGFAVVQLARENLRATQILVQRTEDVRLYSWTQVTNSSYFKTTFTDWYNPSGTNNNTAGAVYKGNVNVAIPPIQANASDQSGVSASYANNMRAVTLTLFWTNYVHGTTNTIVRSRQMKTYVSRFGMQNYVSK